MIARTFATALVALRRAVRPGPAHVLVLGPAAGLALAADRPATHSQPKAAGEYTYICTFTRT